MNITADPSWITSEGLNLCPSGLLLEQKTGKESIYVFMYLLHEEGKGSTWACFPQKLNGIIRR